jgi:hypothetical protein
MWNADGRTVDWETLSHLKQFVFFFFLHLIIQTTQKQFVSCRPIVTLLSSPMDPPRRKKWRVKSTPSVSSQPPDEVESCIPWSETDKTKVGTHITHITHIVHCLFVWFLSLSPHIFRCHRLIHLNYWSV